MKFKKGDRVRIIKPTCEIDSDPGWVDAMDFYNGKIVTLKKISESDRDWWTIGSWSYDESWLELVDNPTKTFDDAMSVI